MFDDTDVATLEYIRPIYDHLSRLGLMTTKSVWSLDYAGTSDFQGTSTLEDPAFAAYMRELHDRGFEIAFHGATMESSARPDIKRALEVFARETGGPPAMYASHSNNRDNLYWGRDRFSFRALQWIYTRLKSERTDYFQGHTEGSEYFWGDLAQRHFRYVRGFTFAAVDLMTLGIPLTYRRPDTPWVNRWFISADAENVEEFNALLTSKSQQALEDAGGVCIVSTHFGKGFVERGELHPVTRRVLDELAAREGWFVPVSRILDLYVEQLGCPVLGGLPLLAIEARWLIDSLSRNRRHLPYRATEVEYLARAMGSTS